MEEHQPNKTQQRGGKHEASVKKKEWTIHLVDEDAPTNHDMKQADALLAAWIIRIWRKQKEAAMSVTDVINSDKRILE